MSVTPVLCTALLAMLAPVELRSGDVIDTPITSMGPGGVTLGGAQSRVVGWDRVARVTGASAEAARAYQTLAVDAWRARARLARADLALATPLFERLYTQTPALTGPTGLLIAEGTMRCRLETDPRGATEAWLTSLALRAQGAKIDGEPVAAGFTDQVTGLVPALPPMFVDGEAPDALTTDTEGGRAGAYERLYAFAMGAPISDAVRASSPDAAIEFVRVLVLAQRGDADERVAARKILKNQRQSDQDEGWRDAWRLAAIGRSLTRSEEPDERLEGVFALLEIPARWGATQAHLSAVCLRDAAITLDDLGRADEASRLREELARTFPDHPASIFDDTNDRTTQEPA